MRLHRFALFACAAILEVQPAVATSPAPLGRFGVWKAWSSPAMLPPVGQPIGEMGASISAYGKSVRWNVDVSAKSYAISTQDGPCHQRTSLLVEGTSSTTIINTLKKQTEVARKCSRRASLDPVERLNFSRRDLQKALLVLLSLVRPKRDV